MTDPRRALPSVGALLEGAAAREHLTRAPRTLVADAARDALALARSDPASAPTTDAEWAEAIGAALDARAQRSLRPVINATGVVLHTNLGRAPLAAAALAAVADIGPGYANLEYDLDAGTRGSRYVHCTALLRELTGAEDAMVVNNGASALLLALNTLADGADAIVSRGELIEIGGSFRIPDIMAKSGARLVEVGTTNRTHMDDYRRAIGDRTGAVVKVHRSNFALEGYVADVEASSLAELCAERQLPLIHDLGSGLFLSLERWGLSGEPVVSDAVRDGATVVTMSGDKLCGGPQAGIIVGTRVAIGRMRTNPLTRALRVDKLTLAALEATLALYRDPESARREIPTLALLTASVDDLAARAKRVAASMAAAGVRATVVESEGSVGGGAFPTARLASVALAIDGNASRVERRLREADVPVIARIADNRVLLDLRSVPAADDALLVRTVCDALAPAR